MHRHLQCYQHREWQYLTSKDVFLSYFIIQKGQAVVCCGRQRPTSTAWSTASDLYALSSNLFPSRFAAHMKRYKRLKVDDNKEPDLLLQESLY